MRRKLLMLSIGHLAAFCLLFSTACAMHQPQASPELTVRTSLDVLADVIDPASQIASEACTAQKEAITSSVEAHKTPPAAGASQLEAAIERCNVLRLAFDRIRSLHSQAAGYVNSGQLTQASARLAELRQSWRGLNAPPIALADGGGGS